MDHRVWQKGDLKQAVYPCRRHYRRILEWVVIDTEELPYCSYHSHGVTVEFPHQRGKYRGIIPFLITVS